jgi:hypothetical protein
MPRNDQLSRHDAQPSALIVVELRIIVRKPDEEMSSSIRIKRGQQPLGNFRCGSASP